MDFALRPPEVNSGLMYAGPGSGPMLAAGAAWDAVAAGLESTASGYSAELSGLTDRWFGPSALSMAAAATPYVAWLQASAAQAAQTAAQAYAAAAAYEAAFAMTVPPPVIAANRSLLMALIATNFFGQNTPAIAATEAQYMQMWAQDATTMYVYAADSSTVSTLTPVNEPPRTTNQAGQGAQARAVAQTAGNATSAHTQTLAQAMQPAATHQLASTAGVDPSIPPGDAATAGPGGATMTVTNGSVTVGPGSIISLGQADTITGGSSGAMLSAQGFNDISLAAGQTFTYSQFQSAFLGFPTGFSVAQGSVVISNTSGVASGSITLPAGSSAIAGANGASVTVTIGTITVGTPSISTTSTLGGTATVIGTLSTTSTTAPAVTVPTTTAPSITVGTTSSISISTDFSFLTADQIAGVQQWAQSMPSLESLFGSGMAPLDQAISEAVLSGAIPGIPLIAAASPAIVDAIIDVLLDMGFAILAV